MTDAKILHLLTVVLSLTGLVNTSQAHGQGEFDCATSAKINDSVIPVPASASGFGLIMCGENTSTQGVQVNYNLLPPR